MLINGDNAAFFWRYDIFWYTVCPVLAYFPEPDVVEKRVFSSIDFGRNINIHEDIQVETIRQHIHVKAIKLLDPDSQQPFSNYS